MSPSDAKDGIGRAPASAVPLDIRRVVTGHTPDGESTVIADGSPRVCAAYEHIPGMATRLVWATTRDQPVTARPADIAGPELSHVPGTGETRFIIATFPPDSVFGSASFDPAAAQAENALLSPGLAELFDETGFHETNSIDYAIVLEGVLTLELTDGSRTVLNKHDVVVQHGTRHAWRNETDAPASVAFMLTGAPRRL